MEAKQPLSPNMVYKKYVTIKSKAIPFSDFIEVENRKYKLCQTTMPFNIWLDAKYSQGGDKAWFNQGTARILSEIGYSPDSKYANLTEEQADSLAKGVTALSTLATNLAAKKANRTDYEVALKKECGNPLIKGKKYKDCVLKFDAKLKAAAPTYTPPSTPQTTGGMSMVAWASVGIGIVIVGGLVIYAIKNKSKNK